MGLYDYRPVIGVTSELKFLEQWLSIFLIKHGYHAQSVKRNLNRRSKRLFANCELIIVETSRNTQQSLALTNFFRQESNAAILLLSHSPKTLEIIAGLEAGADDVVQTPYELPDLLIRIEFLIQAQRRRAGCNDGTTQDDPACVHQIEKLVLNNTATLTESDRKLLKILMEQPFTTIGRDQLRKLLSANGQSISSLKSIDAAISRLRKKFCENKAAIKTARGRGYLLELKNGSDNAKSLRPDIRRSDDRKISSFKER